MSIVPGATELAIPFNTLEDALVSTQPYNLSKLKLTSSVKCKSLKEVILFWI